MTTEADLLAIAAKLRAAYGGLPIAPLTPLLAGGDLDAAYRVQDINTRHWESAGRVVVGCKIGLTSRAVQRQLGVDQPDYGMLFADMGIPDGERVRIGVMQPRIEAEVAIILSRDLDGMPQTRADVAAAVDYVVPALEVVGSRIADWKIGILDTVADNASSGGFVLGKRRTRIDEIDLELAGMVLEQDDEAVSFGVGAACLGHPLEAALWLARRMAELGRPLRAGWTVLTGALGPMVPVAAGSRYTAKIAGLGSVSVAFE